MFEQGQNWNIRIAELTDIDEMQRVRMSVRENTLQDYSILTPELYKLNMVDLGCGWVCEQGRRIIGFAIVNLKELNLWALFVEPGAEGRGIGRALHDTTIAWLRDKRVTHVKMDTQAGTRAAQFYEAAGWRLLRTDEKNESFYELEL